MIRVMYNINFIPRNYNYVEDTEEYPKSPDACCCLSFMFQCNPSKQIHMFYMCFTHALEVTIQSFNLKQNTVF